MSNKFTVLVVDDHQIFSQSLKILLDSLAMFTRVDSCYSGEVALKLVEETNYDLVLLDWNLGDGKTSGAQLVQQLVELLPNGRVIILSALVASGTVYSAIDAGAASYLPKTISADQLLDAIQLIVSGGIYLPQEVMPYEQTNDNDKTNKHCKENNQLTLQSSYPNLSLRQIEVLLLVLKGMNNRMIANNLNISEGTVKQHLNSVFREMGVRNRTEAIYHIAQKAIQVFI